MSLFKKSNRKVKSLRVRHEDSDEEKSDKNIRNQLSINENQIKTQNNNTINDNKSIDKQSEDSDDFYDKSNVKTFNSKLSFHDEEEDCDVFKVKKSSWSRRTAKQLERKKKRDEKRKESKVEKNGENNDKNNTKEELNVIWIKSEEMKTKPPEEEILSGEQITKEMEELDVDEEYRNNEPFHHFRGALERGVIPDAKTIYALKKQRQLARDIDEFIPIDVDDKYDDNESRIIRDDENDKSDDDEDEDDDRISFAVNKDKIEREKAREAFRLAQEEDEEEDEKESEDELERWEMEQIKKGVRMPSIQILAQEQASTSGQFGFTDNLTVINMDIDKPFKSKKHKSIPNSILNKFKNKVSVDEICEKLKQKLELSKESLERHERQVVNISNEMNVCAQGIKISKDRTIKLVEKYELLQKISKPAVELTEVEEKLLQEIEKQTSLPLRKNLIKKELD